MLAAQTLWQHPNTCIPHSIFLGASRFFAFFFSLPHPPGCCLKPSELKNRIRHGSSGRRKRVKCCCQRHVTLTICHRLTVEIAS